jgi:hypothetical protein
MPGQNVLDRVIENELAAVARTIASVRPSFTDDPLPAETTVIQITF